MRIRSVTVAAYGMRFREGFKSLSVDTHERKGWHLLVNFTCGIVGRGEVLTWPGFGSTQEELKEALGACAMSLHGVQIASLEDVNSCVEKFTPTAPEVRVGLEMALLDALGLKAGVPIWRLLRPTGGADWLPTRSLLTSWTHDPREKAPEVVKVKALPTLAETRKALDSLLSSLPENTPITVDANQQWDRDDWLNNGQTLEGIPALVIEEPCPSWWLAPVPYPECQLAVDESLFLENQQSLKRQEVAQVTIKPPFTGGWQETIRLANEAHAKGRKVVFSSALGTMMERAWVCHMASAYGGPCIVGLGPFLQDSAFSSSLKLGDDGVQPPMSPGLGLRTPSIGVGGRVSPTHQEARRAGSTPRWIQEGITLTHDQWEERVEEVAKNAQTKGVRPGDVVILPTDAPMDFALRWDALRLLGAIGACIPHMAEDQVSAWAHQVGAHWLWSADALIHRGESVPRPSTAPLPYAWSREEVRAIIQTSGTTGTARPEPISHDQFLTSAMASALRLEHTHEDKWLLALPLHRVGGVSILERTRLYGTTVVLPDSTRPEAIKKCLVEQNCTHVSLVPTQLLRLTDTWGEDPTPSALRVVLVGGGPLSEEAHRKALQLGLPVVRTWGMTESASQGCTEATTDSPSGDRSALPLSLLEVRESTGGHLVLEGPQVGGSHWTGDVGRTTQRGEVFVLGRGDDVLISGGVNIAPEDVESELALHASVSDVAAVGIQDPEWGERLVVVVLPSIPYHLGLEEDLQAWCSSRLAPTHRPKEFHFVEEPLRNDMGKIPRKQLRDWLAEKRRGSK